MKLSYLCQSSYNLRILINPILDDDVKLFKLYFKDDKGWIDRKTVFEMCLESNATKILKMIINNNDLLNKLRLRKATLSFLNRTKALNFRQKNKLFKTKLSKNYTFTDKYIFKLVKDNGTDYLKWLPNNHILNERQLLTLFEKGINEKIIQYITNKKINLNSLIYKFMKKYPYELEKNLIFFNDEQVIAIVNYLIDKTMQSKKEIDVNITDTIIKTIMIKNYLIDKFNISSLNLLKVRLKEKTFNFLIDDIDKIVLFTKFNNKSMVSKTKCIKI